VAFYGGDRTPALGVLGGVPPDEVAVKLQRQAKGYEQGDTPIVPVFELITVVASFHPGPDNLYRFRDDPGVVQGYIDAIRKVHGLMVIDIQPGRADFMTEIKPYEQFLKQPDVGLALDGEWHVGPDQVPGVVIGNITADTVNQVSAYLSGIVQRNNLPQKLLIIHQFTEGEIHDRARIITDRPGLAMVLDIDGFGGALTKTLKYQGLTAGTDRYYHGIKLYYGQDVNLMSPMQVLALRPSPDIIIYQ